VPPSTKPIEFTLHADEMMAARGISRNQVVNTIRQPGIRKAGNTSFTQRLEREFHPSRWLVVIVEELVDRFKVVITYWKS
jgi:hypothetical protein